MQFEPGQRLLGRLDDAALALDRHGVAHFVRLVEDDHAVEILAGPIDDLLDALEGHRPLVTRTRFAGIKAGPPVFIAGD